MSVREHLSLPGNLSPPRGKKNRTVPFFRDWECLVVHFVPVRWGAGRVRCLDELCGSEAVVGVGAVFYYSEG